MKLPRHEASLTLEHNGHKDYYQTVEEWDASERLHGYDLNWISEEQRQKAFETNEAWTIHWYPDTPVGFINLAACDLDALLAEANEGKHEK